MTTQDKIFTYRVSLKNYLICVFAPLLLLLFAKLSPQHFNDVITTWHLLSYAVVGIATDFVYQYKRKSYTSITKQEIQELSKLQSLGLTLILYIPLFFTILILVTFYVHSN